VRFEVFKAARIMKFFWVLAPCSPEDGDSMFLRTVGIYRRVYTAPKPRRTTSSKLGLIAQRKIVSIRFLAKSGRHTKLSV
jgi:hypothetical protein